MGHHQSLLLLQKTAMLQTKAEKVSTSRASRFTAQQRVWLLQIPETFARHRFLVKSTSKEVLTKLDPLLQKVLADAGRWRQRQLCFRCIKAEKHSSESVGWWRWKQADTPSQTRKSSSVSSRVVWLGGRPSRFGYTLRDHRIPRGQSTRRWRFLGELC